MTREEAIKNIKEHCYFANLIPRAKESLDMAIKVLEQEACEDCVSRKGLLKIYEDRFLELQKLKHLKDNKGAEDRQMGVNYCINILKEMSSVTPQESKWIPVSERLPEEFESVLVCYKSQGGMAQAVSEGFGTHTGYKWSSLMGIEPIAWMPLPKPYKQKGRDKNEID